VIKKIEKIMNEKMDKLSNSIPVLNQLTSLDISNIANDCSRYFETNISEVYLWRIEKGIIPDKYFSREHSGQWFCDDFNPYKKREE
jgi:hypothetical protein